MLLYAIKSAVTLALLYTCFYLLLKRETFHRFNRMILIGILLTSVLLPMVTLTTTHPTNIGKELYDMEERMQPGGTVMEFEDGTAPIRISLETPGLTPFAVIQLLYGLGMACRLLFLVWHIIALKRQINNGLCRTDSYGNTIVLKRGDIPPFSFFRYIVMSVDDYEKYRTYMLPHEQEHIRQKHSYDLLLLEVVRIFQWFNPFVWLLADELKAVHEYAVDEAILHTGIDAKQYQKIIVTKATRNRLQPFANHLRHGSLKQRIIMMYRKESSKSKMLKACFLLPVVCFTLACFAKPNMAKQVKQHVQAAVSTDTERPTHASDGWPILYDLPLYDGPQKYCYKQFVSRKEDGTYITFVCTSPSDDQLYKFGGPNCYLVDPNTGIHYKAKRSIPEKAWDYFHLVGMKDKTWTVTVVFPPIPKNVKEVEFYGVTSHLQNSELHNLNH